METDSPDQDDDAGAPSTSAQARATLEALDTDAAQLADQLASPWWYHLTLGGIVAVAIGIQGLPEVSSVVTTAGLIIWIPFLMQLYTSRYRISMTRPAGPRSRRMLLLILVALGLLMVGVVLLKIASLLQWWVLLLAAVGFVATVVLGRRYDAVLRAEIADPASPAEQQ